MVTQTLWTEDAVVRDLSVDSGATLILRRNGDARVLSAPNSINPVRTHTAKSDFDAEFPYDESLEDWVFSDIYIYWNDELLFRGKAFGTDSDEGGSLTRISGPDVGAVLENAETRVVYTNIAAHDAIDDYGNNHTPFSWTVHPPSPTLVADDEQVQEADTDGAFGDITSLTDTDPFEIRNNEIESLQTGWTTEGEDYETGRGDSLSPESDPAFSGGEAANLTVDSHSREWDFTIEHTIPDDEFELWIRNDVEDPNVAASQWSLLDSGGSTIASSDATSFGVTGLEWRNVGDSWGGLDVGELAPGDYTIQFDITNDSGGQANYYIDDVAPLDALTRYTEGSDATDAYTFDNDNGGSGGYLDGPQWFTPGVEIFFSELERSYNVTGASATLTAADDTAPFEIAFSNDGGDTWEPDEESTSPSVTFDSTYGTTIQARATLGRYGSRTDATPQEGYQGQTLGDWDLFVDGNDLPVIDELTLEDNHLANLQRLHDLFAGRFVLKHLEDSLEAESFQPGDVEQSASWTTINRTRTKDVGGYFNKVVVRGATKPEDEQESEGERYTATAEDEDSIGELGEIVYVDRDPTLESRSACIYRARTLLSEFLAERSLTGSIEIVPEMIDPGFRYEVGAWGATPDLEQVTYSLGQASASGSLEFDLAVDLVSSQSQQRKEVSKLKERL